MNMKMSVETEIRSLCVLVSSGRQGWGRTLRVLDFFCVFKKILKQKTGVIGEMTMIINHWTLAMPQSTGDTVIYNKKYLFGLASKTLGMS